MSVITLEDQQAHFGHCLVPTGEVVGGGSLSFMCGNNCVPHSKWTPESGVHVVKHPNPKA